MGQCVVEGQGRIGGGLVMMRALHCLHCRMCHCGNMSITSRLWTWTVSLQMLLVMQCVTWFRLHTHTNSDLI